MSISFAMHVCAAPEVMFRAVGEESVLLNVKTSIYLGADAVGTRMWVLLTEKDTIQHAYDSLLEEFEVAPDDLRRDLNEFLQKLLEHGLIEIRMDNADSSASLQSA